MKNFTLLVGLLLFSKFIYCQENAEQRNSVRFGINRVFFGSGDVVGPGIYGEYSYSLNSYFALTPRIMIAYANRNSEDYYSHASSLTTSLSIRITPLPNSFSRLKLDFGGLYHRFIDTYGSMDVEDQYGQQFSDWSYYYTEDLIGLIGSLNINVVETSKFEVGTRFDMLTSFTDGYFNCDSWQTGIFLGLKF